MTTQPLSKYRGTIVVYLLILLAALFVLGTAISQNIRTVALKQFHLRQDSFATFAAVHFVPPMYNFANEVWYSNELVDFKTITQDGLTNTNIKNVHFWFNHYPMRMITFSFIPRGMYFKETKDQYIYVRSNFMDDSMQSIYQLKPTPNGLLVERIPTGDSDDKD